MCWELITPPQIVQEIKMGPDGNQDIDAIKVKNWFGHTTLARYILIAVPTMLEQGKKHDADQMGISTEIMSGPNLL